MSCIDPKFVNVLKQLKHKAAKRKKRSIEMIGTRTSTHIVDVVPPVAVVQPINPKKKGCLTRSPKPRIDVRSSSRAPSILGNPLQLA